MQFGLVLALLLAYFAIEYKSPVDTSIADIPSNPFKLDEQFIPDTTPEKVIPKEVVRVIPEPILADPILVKDDPDIMETIFDPKDFDPLTPVQILNSIPDELPVDDLDDDKEIPFLIIEYPPKFPGCEGDNEEIRQCFSDSVRRLITKNFNGNLIQDLGLSPGNMRIFVQFKVGKDGKIVDVVVKAPHKSLQNEAIRVVDLLPEMRPGKQRGKAVSVSFTLPISILVQ
jgi:protein TonB